MYCGGKGILVAIEGIDGAGKTTVAKIMVEKLKELGYMAEYTYEPSQSLFSEALKKYIDTYGEAEPEIETLAMALDRLYHVKKVIEPLLDRGCIVVSDRYLYSSIAYQGARGINIEWIENVNKFVKKPDIAIYLRIPINVALERIRGRESSRWRYFESIDRLKKVQEIYELLVSKGILISINATQSIDEIIKECLDIVLKKIREIK